jgi:hypothetical protein
MVTSNKNDSLGLCLIRDTERSVKQQEHTLSVDHAHWNEMLLLLVGINLPRLSNEWREVPQFKF